MSVVALRLRRYLSISYWLLIITLDYTGTSFPRSETTFSSKQSIVALPPFLKEKKKSQLFLKLFFVICLSYLRYIALSSNDSRFIIQRLIFLPGKITWRVITQRNVKGGALWSAWTVPAFRSRLPDRNTHTVVQRRVCVRRACVWAPVVIVVNLTTVKAVTACPYRPVYAIESRASAAQVQRKISLSWKSRDSRCFSVSAVI